MTLPYPDGATEPLETRIAVAILARLRLLHRDNGLFLAHVGETPAMPSRMSGDAWDMLVQQVRGQAPAALVVIDAARTTTTNTSLDRWQLEYELTVALFSNHRRDTITGRINPDTASLAANGRDPGLRAACELADMLLRGWRPDVAGTHEIKPGSRGMQTVFVGQAGTMRELDYRVVVDVESSSWPDPVRHLDSIRTALDGFAVDTEVQP